MNDIKITIGVIVMVTLLTTFGLSLMSANPIAAFVNSEPEPRKAPTSISGDNVYVAWWTNSTGNNEVMFRASSDGGNTFGDKINLSNTTDADSTRVEIDSESDNVVVTWWETSQTEDTPVMRVSNDFGKTFGPLLELGVNGTIGTGEVKPIL